MERPFQHVVVAPSRTVVVAEVIVVVSDQRQVGCVLTILNGNLNKNLARQINLVEVNFNRVFRNDPGIFESLNPGSYGWRGQMDEFRQVTNFDTTIVIKFLDNGKIGFVGHSKHLIF